MSLMSLYLTSKMHRKRYSVTIVSVMQHVQSHMYYPPSPSIGYPSQHLVVKTEPLLAIISPPMLPSGAPSGGHTTEIIPFLLGQHRPSV